MHIDPTQMPVRRFVCVPIPLVCRQQEAADDALHAIVVHALDVHPLAGCEAERGDVPGVREQHAAFVMHAMVAKHYLAGGSYPVGGAVQMVRLSPSSAAADGSSATLLLPAYANGAFSLQILGSASQPLLQIVPTLTSYDQQSDLFLYGSGFVENGSVYSFAGANVSDTDANVDVYYDSEQNRRAQLNRTALPVHGIGNVSVTTEGGTSAPLALNVVQVNATLFAVGRYPVEQQWRLWFLTALLAAATGLRLRWPSDLATPPAA